MNKKELVSEFKRQVKRKLERKFDYLKRQRI